MNLTFIHLYISMIEFMSKHNQINEEIQTFPFEGKTQVIEDF